MTERKKYDLTQQSVEDIAIALGKMVTSVTNIKRATEGGITYERVNHYVGMNFELHAQELEHRGHAELADYYRREWRKI